MNSLIMSSLEVTVGEEDNGLPQRSNNKFIVNMSVHNVIIITVHIIVLFC